MVETYSKEKTREKSEHMSSAMEKVVTNQLEGFFLIPELNLYVL